jgi:hypothetical protein
MTVKDGLSFPLALAKPASSQAADPSSFHSQSRHPDSLSPRPPSTIATAPSAQYRDRSFHLARYCSSRDGCIADEEAATSAPPIPSATYRTCPRGSSTTRRRKEPDTPPKSLSLLAFNTRALPERDTHCAAMNAEQMQVAADATRPSTEKTVGSSEQTNGTGML